MMTFILSLPSIIFRRTRMPLAALLLLPGFQMRTMAATADASEPVNKYRTWHEAALHGDVDEIDVSIENFEEQLQLSPDDPLAKAYLGSVCALRAKESFWGMTKLEYLERADQLMSKAIAEAPDNPRIRMIRAISLYKLPERFDKRPVALADFQQLVPIARAGESDLTLRERQAILYYASLSYADANLPGAGQLKADCHSLSPDSEYGKLTQ
ncbi:hypothetical protein H5P28_09320 [Ruficoccus amylovorans]|uniref:Tetratricopeptide repeat protein n=1 Tax=Ruficoccus amylovorans TaxID=1804625 RepID=A0A842HFP5_9BACT|nr:hypothetical protein [Ruficoccus amylovorans]MBC2594456.1 hypothetical protein [Ruficoccus amylovorans]